MIKTIRAKLEKLPVLALVLTLAVMIFPLHAGAQWVCAAAIALLALVLPIEQVLGMYVFLFPMDEVTVITAIGGSVSRVVQGILVLRFGVWYIAQFRAEGRKIFKRIRLSDVLVEIFAVFAVVMGLINHGISGETVSFAVNMAIFLLMRPIVRAKGTSRVLEILLKMFIYGALAAIAVGIVQGRFVSMLFGGDMLSYARFKGTYEPNFTAVYLSIAIMLVLCLEAEKPWLDAVLVGILGGGLLLTYSMTCIVCFFVTAAILLVVRRMRLRSLLRRIVMALPIAALFFGAVTGYVAIRGVDAFDRGMLTENIHENVYYVTQEDYAKIREGADFHEVAKRASDVTPEEAQAQVVGMHKEALESGASQGTAWIIRLQEAVERLLSGDLDALTSGRYGLVRMKLEDFGKLPLWQKLLGTGPDAVMTFQPNAMQMNYSHNSYADMLYSYGIIGFVVLVGYLVYIQKRRRFCGEEVIGNVASALFMGRMALLVSAMTLSLHISRVMLFFIAG